jgi:hypothetical protein
MSRQSNVSNGLRECSICLETLRDGDVVTRFSCSHVMHFECANNWMSARIRAGKAGTCPMWSVPIYTYSIYLTDPVLQTFSGLLI